MSLRGIAVGWRLDERTMGLCIKSQAAAGRSNARDQQPLMTVSASQQTPALRTNISCNMESATPNISQRAKNG
ncbi:hypothetical protein RRF57_010560 [Xylaria bambusicola]|uniref:Uncharacterized protein n=1 Tax=Xylaria bambusicola TaxID=326684 RepID=A0AAN7Z8K8_9PEZI